MLPPKQLPDHGYTIGDDLGLDIEAWLVRRGDGEGWVEPDHAFPCQCTRCRCYNQCFEIGTSVEVGTGKREELWTLAEALYEAHE